MKTEMNKLVVVTQGIYTTCKACYTKLRLTCTCVHVHVYYALCTHLTLKSKQHIWCHIYGLHVHTVIYM